MQLMCDLAPATGVTLHPPCTSVALHAVCVTWHVLQVRALHGGGVRGGMQMFCGSIQRAVRPFGGDVVSEVV
jgi:hypothetical protein